jgi:hypothetical protein
MITKFSILAHLDQLEIVKETSTDYHCQCPLGQDGGFKIEKKTGQYSGFKCAWMKTLAGKKKEILLLLSSLTGGYPMKAEFLLALNLNCTGGKNYKEQTI